MYMHIEVYIVDSVPGLIDGDTRENRNFHIFTQKMSSERSMVQNIDSLA